MSATGTQDINVDEFYAKLLERHKGNEVALRGVELSRKILQDAGKVASEDRIFIGTPHIHTIEPCAVEAAIVTASQRPHLVSYQRRLTSLLAFGFNHLWVDCLNQRKYKYFCLLHADIGFRTQWWLDKLIEDLERKNLDAIHVPMAIKDERGLMSSGIGNAKNMWAQVRRITSIELQKLPPVFEAHDVFDVMQKTGPVPEEPVFCPNTGVLVIKMDERWVWDFPGFAILDRLETRVTPDGVCVREPRVVPEDWHFGFWMQRHGLRVGGCKRVRTDHSHPHMSYPNDRVWGQTRDEAYCMKGARR